MSFGIVRCAGIVARIVPHAGNGAVLRAALLEAARAHEGRVVTPVRWEVLVSRASWVDIPAAPGPVSVDAIAVVIPAAAAPARLQLRHTGAPWREPFDVGASASMVRQLLR
jgi:hypothetical protein